MYLVVLRAYRQTLPQITVALFGVLSASPLMKTYMTCSDDGVFHIHKALGLETLIRLGHWFPRWTPHMAHGFGYPLYNFYAPLSSYFLAGIHSLGPIYPLALHIALGICIVLSGLAVFYLVRDYWGPWSGLAAAVVYQTSPYVAFNVLFRGALAETMALSIMPIAVWAMDRTLRNKSTKWAVVASLSFGALIYTHSATALLVAPLLLFQVGFSSYRKRDVMMFVYGFTTLVLAIFLSANFWLPALAERNLVKMDQLLVPPVFSYHTNFLSISELLSFPRATIQTLINPSPPKALGVFASSAAILGAVIILVKKQSSNVDENRYKLVSTVTFLTGMLLYGFLTLSISRPIWDILPLLKFVQFPWRALGVTTLCASVLAGGIILFFRSINTAILGSVAIASLSLMAHLSWWYPRYCSQFTEPTLGSIVDYEYSTATIGTSAKGEFTPKTTSYFPDDSSLAEAIKNNQAPLRLIGAPDDAIVETIQADPLDYITKVSSTAPFTATYQTIYYLGWKVNIDDVSTKLKIADGTGLIQFDVPSGEHKIQVYFGTTPIRNLGATLSIMSLCVLVAVFVFMPDQKPVNKHVFALPRKLPQIWIVPLLLLAVKVTAIDKTNNIFHRISIDPSSLGIPLSIDMDNGMRVLAHNISPDQIVSGDTVETTVYVEATKTMDKSFRPYFLLKGAEGTIWNLMPHETVPPRWHREPPPTQYWAPGQYGQFARQYQTMPGTPPGQYNLTVAFFDESTLETVSVAGSFVTHEIDLGKVSVVRPSLTANLDTLPIDFDRLGHLTNEIELLGATLDRQQAAPGEMLTITLFFYAYAKPAQDEFVTLGLDGTSLSKLVEPTPGLSTSQWEKGDLWTGQHLIRVPADTSAGTHYWTASSSLANEVSLGYVDINTPNRLYEKPSIRDVSQLYFGNDIVLRGHEFKNSIKRGEILDVKLLWQALGTPDRSLNVFVHLENANGVVVAQHDGVPVNWSRPTPGWLPEEYIVDTHSVLIENKVLPGHHNVYVGMSDRSTGLREPHTTGLSVDNRAYVGSVLIE
ncbi:MAG TPA: hypothetical protein DGN60_06080 [Chloroflexi bacterium]|nr:hypothetical protein [Chloroflexota bacterium]|tara:strand:- start:8689 stop:11799 length:3111 start_codon:yes stop_codon:yes gene_type:complete